MAEGKMTKEELREDKVITALTEMGQYVKKNALSIGIIVGLVVAALVVFQIVRGGRERAEQQAAVIVLEGETQYQAGRVDDALGKFVDAADRFSGTRTGKVAMLRAADCHLEKGNLEEARANYERFLATEPSDGMVRASALRGLAGASESMEQYEEAAGLFQEASELVGNPLRPEDLLSAGNAWRSAGRFAEAQAAYEKLLMTFPGHILVGEARDGLAAAKAQSGS